MTTWTKISKPTQGSSTSATLGSPIGLLIALTYSTTTSVMTGGWTAIPKASGTNWTKVSKASGTSWTKITKAS